MSAWRSFGKFKVGIVDVEYMGNAGASSATVDPHQHLSGRLFYPAAAEAQQQQGWRSLRGGVPWLPGYNYAKGMAKFLFFRTRGLVYSALQFALQNFAYLVGSAQLIDLYPGAPPAPSESPHPLVVFSHGLGGNRAMYSIFCSELASQGYVVLAVEHADGSASACRLARDKGWMFYRGLGGEEGQVAKTRHRVHEMKTALKILRALGRGDKLAGLELSHGANPSTFLKGALDFSTLAAAGHSYGGATTAALIAEDPSFRCGVALDPWWYAVPPESAALVGWKTRAPLLVVGSHDWSVPNVAGHLPCGESRQTAILQAARTRGSGEESAGAGAILLVVSGSSHNTFADPLALFGQHLGWLLDKLGLASRLDPVLGIHLANTAALAFLSQHLPLAPAQRAMQNWEPSKGHGALDRIKERCAADQVQGGLLSKVLPASKGFLSWASDSILNRALRGSVRREHLPARPKDGGLEPGTVAGGGSSDAEGADAPDDVLTATEALEAVMPSAEPASGPHPHAPSQPTAVHLGSQGEGEERASAADEAQRAGALSALRWQYCEGVQAGEGQQYTALLGPEHIFRCEVHA